MHELFIGPWRYWLLWVAIIAVLYLLGSQGTHVRHFVPFCFAVLALAAAAVGFAVLTNRRDERVMREPIDEVVADE